VTHSVTYCPEGLPARLEIDRSNPETGSYLPGILSPHRLVSLERSLLLVPARRTRSDMITWSQFGAYVSVAFTIFAGGVGLCWFAFWRH